MKKSYLEKLRQYNYECEEIYSEQALNYERLEKAINHKRMEEAIINAHLELDMKRTIKKKKKKEKQQKEWETELKIQKIPKECGKIQGLTINLTNDLKYLTAFFLYKKKYAKYTSANKELLRIFPIIMYSIAQYGALLFSVYLFYQIWQRGFNIMYAIIAVIIIVFSFIFRMAKIEINQTRSKKVIERSFNGTIGIIGLIIAIIAVAVDINMNKNDNSIIKSSDCPYFINTEQIAYMSDADENGEYTIYFSSGVTLNVTQSTYDEICEKMGR